MIVAGIGCRLGAGVDEIVAVIDLACARAGCRAEVLAVADFRVSHPAIVDAIGRLGIALRSVDRRALADVQHRCATSSAMVARHVGVGSASEAAALAVAGPHGRLILARIVVGGATCALAEAP